MSAQDQADAAAAVAVAVQTSSGVMIAPDGTVSDLQSSWLGQPGQDTDGDA